MLVDKVALGRRIKAMRQNLATKISRSVNLDKAFFNAS